MVSGFLACLIPRHFSCDQMPSLKSPGAWRRSHSISANSHCGLPHLLGLPLLLAQLPFSFLCRLDSSIAHSHLLSGNVQKTTCTHVAT